MLISHIAQKMIRESHGNLHDINHFLKVYAYARTIGVSEGLDPAAQTVLEAAALLHDIACPLCRGKSTATPTAPIRKRRARLWRRPSCRTAALPSRPSTAWSGW